jgi:hypothetical protein
VNVGDIWKYAYRVWGFPEKIVWERTYLILGYNDVCGSFEAFCLELNKKTRIRFKKGKKNYKLLARSE